MVALKRIPKHLRSAKARKWAHKSNRVQAAARMGRGVDANTLRKRALHDARGMVLREGCTFTATEETNWQVVRSVDGRTDQYDIVANSKIVKTAGIRRMPKRFRP